RTCLRVSKMAADLGLPSHKPISGYFFSSRDSIQRQLGPPSQYSAWRYMAQDYPILHRGEYCAYMLCALIAKTFLHYSRMCGRLLQSKRSIIWRCYISRSAIIPAADNSSGVLRALLGNPRPHQAHGPAAADFLQSLLQERNRIAARSVRRCTLRPLLNDA